MKEILVQSEGKVLSKVYSGARITDVIPLLEAYPSVYLVYDSSVECHANELRSNLKNAKAKAISANESNKTISTVLEICQWLLENGADRHSLLLAVGGGISTDMAGFAASIYKRGIRFAYIPTTLLAQVDAAIGGKTGVNFLNLKNMLGIIRQPEFTFECPKVLETLPYRDFSSGAAEMLKTFIIENSQSNYETAVSILGAIHNSQDRTAAIKSHLSELLELIHEAAKVKAGVVGRDQFENGERRKLNLGHTFAHAIEKEANYSVTHGEAVAMGIIMAAELSDRLGLTDGHIKEKLAKDFKTCGLPTECGIEKERLAGAMEKDKKAESGIIHFVLMAGIGSVVTKDMTVREAL